MGPLGYIIVLIVAFAIGVDHIARRIDSVSDRLEALRSDFTSVENAIEAGRDGATLSELENIRTTLTGGLAALIALGGPAQGVDHEVPLSERSIDTAFEKLSSFVSEAGWQRRREERAQRASRSTRTVDDEIQQDGIGPSGST